MRCFVLNRSCLLPLSFLDLWFGIFNSGSFLAVITSVFLLLCSLCLLVFWLQLSKGSRFWKFWDVFVFSFFFAFQFGMFLVTYRQMVRFFLGVKPTHEPPEGLLHFYYSGPHVYHILLVLKSFRFSEYITLVFLHVVFFC